MPLRRRIVTAFGIVALVLGLLGIQFPQTYTQVSAKAPARPPLQWQSGTLSLPTLTASVGESLAIPLWIDTDSPTRAAVFGLGWNQNVLRCDGVDEGWFYSDWADENYTTTNFPDPSIDQDTGELIMGIEVVGGFGGPSGAGVLAIFHFTVIDEGTSALILRYPIIAGDEEDEFLDASTENGYVDATGAGSETETATPPVDDTATPSPVPTATKPPVTATAPPIPSTLHIPLASNGYLRGGVEVVAVSTADEKGNQKTLFKLGDIIVYFAVVSNTTRSPQAITMAVTDSGPCGSEVRHTETITVPVGEQPWFGAGYVPDCAGEHTYQFSVDYAGEKSSKSVTYTIGSPATTPPPNPTTPPPKTTTPPKPTTPPPAAATRVLFVGNSFTNVNNLPAMFASLAASGGHKVTTGMAAPDRWKLKDHVNTADTISKIKQGWDIVVLQEQSQVPALSYNRTHEMYPAARTLVDLIRKNGGQPLFFLTWGYRYGDPEHNLPSYTTMQNALNKGYSGIATELNVPIAPVGLAWSVIQSQGNSPNLYGGDNIHPSRQGTYLAACVFYATIFRESPVGLSYTAGLSKADVQRLQTTAANTVFK